MKLIIIIRKPLVLGYRKGHTNIVALFLHFFTYEGVTPNQNGRTTPQCCQRSLRNSAISTTATRKTNGA